MLSFVVLPWLFIIIFVQQLSYGLNAIWITSTIAFFIVAAAGYLMASRLLPSAEPA